MSRDFLLNMLYILAITYLENITKIWRALLWHYPIFMWNCCIPIRSDGYVGFASENPFVFTFVMWVHYCLRGWAASGTALLLLCIKINNVYWALWLEITFLGSLISALVWWQVRFSIFRWCFTSIFPQIIWH